MIINIFILASSKWFKDINYLKLQYYFNLIQCINI